MHEWGEWAERSGASWVGPMDVMKVDQSVVSRAALSAGSRGVQKVASRAEEWVDLLVDWMAGPKDVL